MNVNPEDYDPEELRQMPEERWASNRSESQRRHDDDPAPQRNGDSSTSHRNSVDDQPEGRWSFGAEGTSQHTGPRSSGESRGHPEGSHGAQRPNRASPDGERHERGTARASPEHARGAAADALRSNQLEQLFLHQSAMITEQLSKPYLDSIPQLYAAERVIFDWLEFLVLKSGFKRTMDALRYYRTIDWITEDVEASLQDYLIGFSDDGAGTHDLDVDDHQLSLVYVARLASMS